MNTKRYGNQGFSHVGEVISGLISRVRRETDTELARIKELWQHGLDPAISENSRPEALRGSELLVCVESSAVIQQLRFMTPQIIEQLNRALGDNRISLIRYKAGPVSSRNSR